MEAEAGQSGSVEDQVSFQESVLKDSQMEWLKGAIAEKGAMQELTDEVSTTADELQSSAEGEEAGRAGCFGWVLSFLDACGSAGRQAWHLW